jgi:hypothetical protein
MKTLVIAVPDFVPSADLRAQGQQVTSERLRLDGKGRSIP